MAPVGAVMRMRQLAAHVVGVGLYRAVGGVVDEAAEAAAHTVVAVAACAEAVTSLKILLGTAFLTFLLPTWSMHKSNGRLSIALLCHSLVLIHTDSLAILTSLTMKMGMGIPTGHPGGGRVVHADHGLFMCPWYWLDCQ